MFDKIAYNFFIAVESITFNRLRAVLTSLGIIFGVASVISMLAIGSGAQEEILDQIKLLGANNIIVKPVTKQEEGEVSEEESLDLEEKKPYSPGLTVADAESIVEMIPGVESVNPEVIVETTAIRAGLRRTTRLVGVGESFFDAAGFELQEGRYFSDEHFDNSLPVAIIGHECSVPVDAFTSSHVGRSQVAPRETRLSVGCYSTCLLCLCSELLQHQFFG